MLMTGRPKLEGKQFGNLTVVKLDHVDRKGDMWECQCCCGNTVVTRGSWLRNGMVVSCGCPLIKEEKKPSIISAGQKVRFDPFIAVTGFASEDHRNNPVTGIVVMVNEPHQWFSVEYGNPKMRTSFKFCQIGKDVLICGN